MTLEDLAENSSALDFYLSKESQLSAAGVHFIDNPGTTEEEKEFYDAGRKTHHYLQTLYCLKHLQTHQ